MNLTLDQARRFWAKVDKSGGKQSCWLWTAGVGSGFGRFHVGDSCYTAHRVAAHIHMGQCPAGKVAAHVHCGEALCCNPAHIEYVSHGEAMKAAHRNNDYGWQPPVTQVGESHHSAKLNERKVRWIRKAREIGFTFERLAERFGVTKPCVWRAARGDTWAHV